MPFTITANYTRYDTAELESWMNWIVAEVELELKRPLSEMFCRDDNPTELVVFDWQRPSKLYGEADLVQKDHSRRPQSRLGLADPRHLGASPMDQVARRLTSVSLPQSFYARLGVRACQLARRSTLNQNWSAGRYLFTSEKVVEARWPSMPQIRVAERIDPNLHREGIRRKKVEDARTREEKLTTRITDTLWTVETKLGSATTAVSTLLKVKRGLNKLGEAENNYATSHVLKAVERASECMLELERLSEQLSEILTKQSETSEDSDASICENS